MPFYALVLIAALAFSSTFASARVDTTDGKFDVAKAIELLAQAGKAVAQVEAGESHACALAHASLLRARAAFLLHPSQQHSASALRHTGNSSPHRLDVSKADFAAFRDLRSYVGFWMAGRKRVVLIRHSRC